MGAKNIKNKKVNTIEGLARLMQDEFLGVNNRLGGVENRLANVENDVREMKQNSSALFAKLDEFINLYRESKQEMTAMVKQIRRLEERVAQLESGK